MEEQGKYHSRKFEETNANIYLCMKSSIMLQEKDWKLENLKFYGEAKEWIGFIESKEKGWCWGP